MRMPKFDEAGNIITIKPEIPDWNRTEKLPKLEGFACQFCGKAWDAEISKNRHEAWCIKNPNQRKYRKDETEVEKKPKKPKPRGRPKTIKEYDIIKELKEFDKTFGITDEQIVKYIRGKMK